MKSRAGVGEQAFDMQKIVDNMEQLSPFAGARHVGEFAVGYGLNEDQVSQYLPAGEPQSAYNGRKFPVTHYPRFGAYGASIGVLRSMFPDIPQESSAGTILFHAQQGELIPYDQNNGDTTTAES